MRASSSVVRDAERTSIVRSAPEGQPSAPVPAGRNRANHPLVRYLLIRFGISILLVFGVTLVTFTLQSFVGGDPVQASLGEQASNNPQIVKEFRAKMGLDKPLPVRYVTYVGNLLHGDLGTSWQTNTPVAPQLQKAFPATAELATAAILVSIVLGIGLGLLSALKRGRVADHLIRAVTLVGISAPTFWLALLAYYFIFFRLHLLPGSGRLDPGAIAPPNVTGFYTIDSALAGQWATFSDALGHLILPASVLALSTIGLLTRFARSSVLEVLNLDYVRAARAKGLAPSAVSFRYVLRGALIPIITLVGIAFGSLLSGAVLTETIFGWNGIGQFAYNASTHLDMPSVMGVGLLVGVVFIAINFIVDILYGVLDPRVRRA